MLICHVYKTVAINFIEFTQGPLDTQVDQLLHHVREKFSEVLLPVETVTKLDLIGKGNKFKIFYLTFVLCISYVVLTIGAFGMVHKGKLIMSDSSVKNVAIKTIKCKFFIINGYFVTERYKLVIKKKYVDTRAKIHTSESTSEE